MKKKVLDISSFPTRSPLWPMATCFLLLERFSAPQWVWGALGVLFSFLWFAFFYDQFRTEKIKLRELQ